MAKVHNITLPDGSTIPVPAWATEDTMLQVTQYMAATNKVDQKFLGLMKNLGADVNDLQKEISNLVGGVKNSSKNKTALDAAEASSKGYKTVANAVMKASNFFGDAEKPMTGLVSAAGTLNEGLKNLDEGFMKRLIPEGSKLAGFFSKFGGTLDVATDAGLAYLGWNAAKFEQFAEAQKAALDAGAIFYSSGDQFDQLYSRSMDAGVSYNIMMDAVNQFGGTLTGLGGSVSAGADNFVHMFGNLNEMADQFGDLGLSSKDMLNQYGQFLEYARLSGQLGGATLDAGDRINKSFINLQIEATGLANLTALSKSEAMQRQLAAMTEPLTVLGTSTLRDNGQIAQAGMVDEFVKQLGLIAPEVPEFQGLLDALGREVAETSDNIEIFDIGRRLDGNLRGAIDTALGTDFIPTLNEAVRTGNMANADAQTFILEALANVDQEKLASSGAASGSILRLVQDIQAGGFRIKKNFDNYLSMSEEERKKYLEETGKAMEQSGQSVVIMNEATKQFYQLQDAMTLPMQGTADMFEYVTEGLQKGAKFIKSALGLDDEEDDFGSFKEDGDQTPGSDSTVRIPNSKPSSRIVNTSETATYDPNQDPTVNNLDSLSEHVRDRFEGTIEQFNNTYSGEGYKILLNEGYRSLQKSQEMYESGETSIKPGQSWRNYGMSGDFLIYKDGKLVEDNSSEIYSKLAEIAKQNNLNNSVADDVGYFQPSELPSSVPASLSATANTRRGTRRQMEQQAIELSNNRIENPNVTTTTNTSRTSQSSNFSMRELLEADAELYTELNTAIRNYITEYLETKHPRLRIRYRTIAETKAKNAVYPQFAERINEALGREVVKVSNRRFGGNVSANMPYIVGDELGLQNAELFVPGESGTIVNNADFKTMIQNAGDLTNSLDSTIIEDLEKEYASLLEQKANAVKTARALKDTIKLIHGTKHQKARIDRTNSA